MGTFKLFAPADSNLDPAAFSASIPAPRQWSVIAPRPQESARTLGGGTVRSVWPADVTGAAPAYEQTMTETQYQALVALHEHATQATWCLAADGRLYEVSIDITKADRIVNSLGEQRDVSMTLSIVRRIF